MSEKIQIELVEHLKKATSHSECAPKRKHVRACILFAWDHVKRMGGMDNHMYSSSAFSTDLFWNTLRGLDVCGNEITCFKALVVIHCFLVEGPQMALTDACAEMSFLDDISRFFSFGRIGGYNALINVYVEYIKAKLKFHALHPYFNGMFDYDEYINRQSRRNLDDGYQLVSDLLGLLRHLNVLQHKIISQFSPGYQNECLQSSLIPLVIESGGMYKFATTLLQDLSSAIDQDPLVPLKQSYNEQFAKLQRFYGECTLMKYLTSIIPIPSLPDRSPFAGEERKEPVKRPPSRKPQEDMLILDFGESKKSDPPSTSAAQADPVSLLALDGDPSSTPASKTNPTSVLTSDADSPPVSAKTSSPHHSQDQLLEALRTNQVLTKSLQGQLSMWKNKYDSMAKIYQNLQQEHQGVLDRHSGDKLVDPGQVNSRLEQQLKDQTETIKTFDLENKALVSKKLESDKRLKELEGSEKLIKAQLEQAIQMIETLQTNTDRKWIERIVVSVLDHYEQRINKSVDEFRNPSVSGNTFATLGLIGSIVEKILELLAKFQSEQVETVETAIDLLNASESLCGSIEHFFENTKGCTSDKAMVDDCLMVGRESGELYNQMKQQSGSVSSDQIDKLTELFRRISERTALGNQQEDHQDGYEESVNRELGLASKLIDESIAKLTKAMNNQEGQDKALVQAALKVSSSIALLIKYATESQQEIVAHGRGSESPEMFYKKNSRWSKGLISAAHAVASTILILGEATDGILSGTHTVEHVVVASRQVATATIQLVAASRVKSIPFSKVQTKLEEAAKAVTTETQDLVESIEAEYYRADAAESRVFPETYQQYKIEEMNQQMEILKLEKNLEQARRRLAHLRKMSYHE